MSSYLGDRLGQAECDALRKSFGLPPWAAVRAALPELGTAPGTGEHQTAARDGTDYERLMQERPAGRLGSEV